MSTEVELLVLVPGAGRVAQGEQRNRFVEGIRAAAEDPVVEQVEGPGLSSQAIRLKVTTGAGVRLIDVVEPYWNDLLPSLTQSGPGAQFARGTSLVVYWLFSGIWRGFFRRKYLTVGMLGAGVALVTWYYGTAALFLDAVRHSESAPAALRDTATSLGWMLDVVAGWEVWAVATLAMGIIPVNTLVELMDFSKRFLSDERVGTSRIGLRTQVRARVRDQVNAALAAGSYRKLIVVGHSFGCLVAVDLLADLPLPPGSSVRLVTIGSSIELLSRKDSWPLTEVEKCANRVEVQAWVDVLSQSDWFASGTPLPGKSKKCTNAQAPRRGTFIDAVMSRTHGMYFDTEVAVRAVLG